MTLEITRGDDRTITGKVRDARSSLPWDISGYTFWFTVKRKLTDDDSVAIIRKSTLAPIGGLTITSGTNGTFSVAIDSADTYGLPDRDTVDLFYDLQVANLDGKINTLARGRFIVNCDITRSTG